MDQILSDPPRLNSRLHTWSDPLLISPRDLHFVQISGRRRWSRWALLLASLGSLVASEAGKAHLNPEAGPLSCPDISWSGHAVSIMCLPCVLVLAWADPLCMRQTHFCMVQKREADRGCLSLGRSQEPATTTQRFFSH